MSRSWGHAVYPLDVETRKRDDDALAGIRTQLTHPTCDPETCELTRQRIEEWGWWDPASGTERVGSDPRLNHWHTEWVDGDPQPKWTWCSARCHTRREFIVRYAYITGRAGRTSDAERRVCRKHAEAFAKKYGVPMPDLVEVVR